MLASIEGVVKAMRGTVNCAAANRGASNKDLDGLFQPQGTGSHFARRDDIARLLGYDVPKIDRVLDCAKNRATLLGVGTIAPDSSLLYTPTPRESEDPPCQTARFGFYRTDDTARLSGHRIAAKPDRVGSGRVGRSSSGPTCECAGVARRWDELRGDCEGPVQPLKHPLPLRALKPPAASMSYRRVPARQGAATASATSLQLRA